MKTLLILAALTAPGAANDTARHLENYTAYELAHMDNAGPSSCADLIGPQLTPEDTVSATSCANAVADYFNNVRDEDTGEIPQDRTISYRMECAAKLILKHSEEQTTVQQILDAEFDNSCQPATM